MPSCATQFRRGFPWVLASALVLPASCANARVDPYAAADSGASLDVGPRPNDAAPVDASRDILRQDVLPLDDSPTLPSGADSGVSCRGNNDGVITRDEAPFILGATVTYAVNMDNTLVTVDTAGTPLDGGTERLWDFTAPTAQDHRVLDEVVPPTGAWWASQYPSASFSTVLERATDTYGVYQASATALSLLGAVSHNAGLTDLAMSPPVDVLRYPLSEGMTWTQTVNGTGFDNDTPLTNITQYTMSVDARGEVWTTAGRFSVLRVRTDLSQSVPLTVFRRTSRAYAYVAECWGVVANVVSQDNETAVEFTSASVYQRLSL